MSDDLDTQINDGGNGYHSPDEIAEHQTVTGALARLQDLKRSGGPIAGGLSSAQQGILSQALYAGKDSEYRIAGAKAFFKGGTEEADNFSEAIGECRELGMTMTPVVDTAIFRSACGIGGLLHGVFDALTHTTFTSNNGQRPGFFNRGKNNRGLP